MQNFAKFSEKMKKMMVDVHGEQVVFRDLPRKRRGEERTMKIGDGESAERKQGLYKHGWVQCIDDGTQNTTASLASMLYAAKCA